MAGITSDVYDIFQPTPVPLKELSAIAVSLQVWRCKMNEYRNKRNFDMFCPFDEPFLSKTMLPDLPSMIFTTIDKYVRRFWTSMESWLEEHYRRIFKFFYDHQNSVLEFFDDFVCDYTGAIDYVRTAERMMHCDRFNADEKFAISCTYFFEDDIRRFWPLVSGNVNLNNIVFSESPQVYYWICCLTNNLNKIQLTWQITDSRDSITKKMLYHFMPHNRPSIEYFWNRLPTENRMRETVDIFGKPSFFRFILPKFNDLQLKEFVNEKDFHQLVTDLLKDPWYDEERILSIWMYVQRVMKVDKFIEVVERMLQSEVIDFHVVQRPNRKNWPELCCEIWNSAPVEWERKAVVKITSDIELYGGFGSCPYPLTKRFDLMSTFLSCATSVERRRFWFNCWADLILHVWCDDLSKIMNMCFENEDEIKKFKQNIMAHNDDVHFSCTRLLKKASFDEVNNYVQFLFYDQEPARYFKQRLLQDVFLERDNIPFSRSVVLKGKQFVEFVDDAYADIDRSTEFKIQFLSTPEVQRILSNFALTIDSEEFIEFMDSFTLTEESLWPIKTCIIELYKKAGGAAVSLSRETILSWCLIYHQEI